MTDPEGSKRSWLQEAKNRVNEVFRAAERRCVEWRYGSLDDQKRLLVARLKNVQGGTQALEIAARHKVRIKVVPASEIDGSRGRFRHGGKGPLLRIAANDDVPRMVSTLWHELRHVAQHVERGDLKGGTSRLHDTRAQFMISLMIEADAFTAQALMCLREKQAGHPEYLRAFLKRDSNAAKCVARFLKTNAYDPRHEAAFARALFRAIFDTALDGYKARYLDGYRAVFKKAADVQSFRTAIGKSTAPPDVIPSERLLQIYGLRGGDVGPLRAQGLSLAKKQPAALYYALQQIEETVAQAGQMDDKAYRAARRDILKGTRRLSAHFRAKAAAAPRKRLIPRIFRPH